MTNNRGGKREGAGRKASPDSRSVARAIRVTQLVDRYLTEVGSGKCEDVIRKSKEFREWVKLRENNDQP